MNTDYPPLGNHCEVWFVDAPQGRRVNSYHIGETVFVMIYDPTLGVTRPQALFAVIDNVRLVTRWLFTALMTMTTQDYIYARWSAEDPKSVDDPLELHAKL